MERFNEQHPSYRHDDILLTYLNKLQVFERMDLRTCSLVSKAWLPRSRYHLFYHVALRADGTHPPRFLELLDSPLGHIVPYVCHLELYEGRIGIGGETRWLSEALPRLAALTAIESLSVHFGGFERSDNGTVVAFFSMFSLLKYLRLGNCTLSSFTQLLDAISASSHLERLVLANVEVVQDSSNGISMFPAVFAGLQHVVRARRVPSRLRVLEMSSCNFSTKVLSWLCGNNVPPVDTLWLNIASRDEVPIWSEFMRSIGSSLQDLTIGTMMDTGGFNSVAAGTLSCHSQLLRL
jgi:hypothetical protein